MSNGNEETLVEAALRVLNTADPFEKARLGDEAANKWLEGYFAHPYDPSVDLAVPDRPARLCNCLISPSDIIARFGKQESMPGEFFTDFVKVAQDEGRHFTLLAARLKELGSFYGALLAHDGLWDSAIATSKDLIARLAVEHCVHEARGLAVVLTTIARFQSGGDNETADLLEEVIYPEEITHCAAGVEWFKYLCLRSRNPDSDNNILVTLSSSSLENDIELLEEVIQKFHSTVKTYFRGTLKRPFNESARKLLDFSLGGTNLSLLKKPLTDDSVTRAVGFLLQWYEPLAAKEAING